MSKFKPAKTVDVFSQQDTPDTSLEAVDAKLYGNVDLVPNSERIVAKPVDIMAIRADIEQPRRTVPLTVRGAWDGNPQQVVPLLDAWQAAAEESIQQKINAIKILKGLGDGIDYKDADGKPLPLPPLASTFVNLLQLGASIHKDKLINPITISRRKEMFLIETGERRWLAHHLLNHFVSSRYGKIKATEVERDVWRQAAENNNRDSLNAIQLARQLAILVMDMYRGDKDVHFDAIETLTFEGCDRRYYAQVENGHVWRIKDGFAERIQAHMGLSSRRMIAAYRRLLRYSDDEKLNDEIWIKADSENWTEGAIRNYFDDLNAPAEPEITELMLPIGNIDDGEITLLTSKAVQTVAGAIAIVQWDANGYVKLKFPDDTTAQMEKNFVSLVPMSEWFEACKRYEDAKKAGAPTTSNGAASPTATTQGTITQGISGRSLTTAQLVGKPVLYNGIAAFVKATSGSESVLIKIGRDERIVHKDSLTLNPTAPEQTLKDYIEQTALDSDDDDDMLDSDTVVVDEINPQIVIRAIADIASILDLPEQPILQDLAELTPEKVEGIVREFGLETMEGHASTYREAAESTLRKLTLYLESYVDDVMALARQIASNGESQ